MNERAAPHGRGAEAVYVDTAAALEAVLRDVGTSAVVGLDTEFVGEETYEPLLCLVQIATGDAIYVIDPLAGLDLTPFWQALTAPGREVIALAARQEVLFCLRYTGRAPEIVFDPQIAAGLVGYGYPLSHTNLVQRVLGARVNGGEAYTDWRRRPLAARQIAYAADDVRHLASLRHVLLDKAGSLGRNDWIASECARAVERLAAGEDEERWRRVSGASNLSRRDLAVLREIWRWRDNEARAANQPPRRVMSDDLMVQIVRRAPQKLPDLFALRGTDRPALRRAAHDIVAAVLAGLSVRPADLPLVLRRDDPPQVALLSQLGSILTNSLALQHQVDVALLATTADLQEFMRWRLGLGDGAEPSILQGWRGRILGQPLLDLVEGRTVIRVDDLRSSAPLRFEAADGAARPAPER